MMFRFQFIILRLVSHQQLAPPTDVEDIEMDDVDIPASMSLKRRMTIEQRVDEKQSQRMRIERLDFRNDENKTPIHLAAMCGHLEWVGA